MKGTQGMNINQNTMYICRKYLKVFTERNCDNVIAGMATFAATKGIRNEY